MSEKIWCVYEVYKKEYPSHNYIGKSYVDNVKQGYRGSGIVIMKAISKHGVNAFDVRILAEFNLEEEAYSFEDKIIEIKKPYYNISPGGYGFRSGERNIMFGKSGRENKSSSEILEWNNKIGHALKGRTLSPTHLQKMRNCQKGVKSKKWNGIKTSYILEVIMEVGQVRIAAKKINMSENSIRSRLRHENIKLIYDGPARGGKVQSSIIGFST